MNKFLGALALLVFAGLVAIIVVSVRGAPQGGVAVIGDRAEALLDASGATQALPVGSAAVMVVAVDGWERLRYIADMDDLCGRACEAHPAVRLVELRPQGSRKVLFLDLSALGGEGDLSCAADLIAAEATGLTAPEASDCVPAELPRTRWVLPFGMGMI